MTAVGLYLDLLAKSLTHTLYEDEPDHDNPNVGRFVVTFTMHYMRGHAVTMLPRARLDNIRYCIETVIAEDIPGDLIETGVWRGGGSIFMRGCLSALGDASRISWVADSFEGLPEPDAARPKEYEFYHSDSMQKHYARMSASLESVRENFRAYGLLSDEVRFLKGWFKDTLPNAPISQLSIMRLDGDYYESTMDALTALYGKLSPGGFVIIDDYGETLWTNCREAVDDFRRTNNISDPITTVDSRCAFWRKSR
jgi:O-methyltransferase